MLSSIEDFHNNMHQVPWDVELGFGVGDREGCCRTISSSW